MEKGVIIPQSSLDENRRGYVMLAAIKVRKSWQNRNILITEPCFDLVNRFYMNQIKQNQGKYHFGTSGQFLD